MLRIGLTGGIGAGKSTVARLFEDRGVPVIDADAIAREVVEPGEPALAALEREFGSEVLAVDGSLDRAALAARAFASPERTAALNAIMHPAIGERTAARYAAHAEAPIVVHDVPLLVENGLFVNYHLCVLVDVPAEVRLARLLGSRGMDEADARRRIAAQASDADRYAACDVVLDNSGVPADLETAFGRLWEDRIVPFAEALRTGRPAAAPAALCGLTEPGRADRHLARVVRALGDPEAQAAPVVSNRSTRPTHRLRVTPANAQQAAEAPARLAAAGWFPTGEGAFASADPGAPALLVLELPEG
ncbi:dephospho-CoA kinase [Brevibacterium samyangense]|uniref:Dephospho-CoA kinase n=1 Tax=Brevibacterium samyangense TaxID=366888 RepID=A0ABP5EZV2_9MICO